MRENDKASDVLADRRIQLIFGAGIVLAFAAMVFFFPSSAPLLEPDSASYLSFSPLRSGGYPAFLDLLELAGVRPEAVPVVQYLLYGLSLGVLAVAVADVLRSRTWAAAISVMVIAAKPVHDLHGQVLTDSLFLTLINGIATCLLYYQQRPGLWWLAGASFLVGLGIAVRPAAWAFFPLLPIAVVMLVDWARLVHWRTLVAIVLPLLAVLAAERAYYAAAHGWESQSLLPFHLYGKGAMLPSSRMPDGFDEAYPSALAPAVQSLWEASSEGYRSVRRLADAARDNDAYCRFLTHYEAYAQYNLGAVARGEVGVRLSSVLQHIGISRIAANPEAFLALTWAYYRCLWQFGLDGGKAEAITYRDWIVSVRPLPFEDDVSALLRAVPSRYADLYLAVGDVATGAMRITAVIAALLSIAGVVFMFIRRGDHRLRLAALFALWVNGYFVLVALTGVAAARYTLVMLVPLALMIGLPAHLLASRLMRRQSNRR